MLRFLIPMMMNLGSYGVEHISRNRASLLNTMYVHAKAGIWYTEFREENNSAEAAQRPRP